MTTAVAEAPIQPRSPTAQQSQAAKVYSLQRERMLRASCFYFASEKLRGSPKPPYNGRFLLAPFHAEWDELIRKHDRIAILANRDGGKSFAWSFAYPIWKASYDPNGRGYIFSNTKDQAVQLLGLIKDEIEDNPELAHLLPLEGTKGRHWAATGIKLRNGHRIFARGFGTKVRGAHPNWAVCDDVLTDEDMTSERTRQKRIEYFFSAITPMISIGGQLVVVGTPYHQMDLYGELKKKADDPQDRSYVFRKYPVISPNGVPIFPERYNLKVIAKKRIEVGPIRFTREYLVEPVSDEMSIFPESLFRGAPTEVFNARLGMPMPVWRSLGIKSVYIGVDLALSASVGADYTVIFVLGIDHFGNRWVMDIIRAKGLPFQQQLGLINEAGIKYEADLIFIEANQMQRVFGDELIRTSALPIKKFVTTGTGTQQKGIPKGNTTAANKNSLEGGVPLLRVTLENGKWRIPRGDKNSIERTNIWINEMRAFAWVDGKYQSAYGHDDATMACWMADCAARRGGFNFSTGLEQRYQTSVTRPGTPQAPNPADMPPITEEEQVARLMTELEKVAQAQEKAPTAEQGAPRAKSKRRGTSGKPGDAQATQEAPRVVPTLWAPSGPAQPNLSTGETLDQAVARMAWAQVPGFRSR